MSFTVNTKNHDDAVEISLSGSGMITTDFDELYEISDALIAKGSVNLILNIENVKVLNSIGLNALIKMLTKTRNAGGDLTIVNISDKINQLLLLTKLNTVLNIANSIEEAVLSFKN
ncbi:STAS domain-containing protein [Crocinitomix catalasitica]|uniref:STAS domain-containing protein n=1 Tax=Crocinitomix catalasitica TaxID=184607 RepID=UPI00048437FD|nr:STAS domain-containing protein [Crocinitomix catalasitica]|tara:strand:+ start:527 stop:874 length:348 start_codon:yes stop_codon:yes gene_type:complete